MSMVILLLLLCPLLLLYSVIVNVVAAVLQIKKEQGQHEIMCIMDSCRRPFLPSFGTHTQDIRQPIDGTASSS